MSPFGCRVGVIRLGNLSNIRIGVYCSSVVGFALWTFLTTCNGWQRVWYEPALTSAGVPGGGWLS